jgi:hypothetical protein
MMDKDLHGKLLVAFAVDAQLAAQMCYHRSASIAYHFPCLPALLFRKRIEKSRIHCSARKCKHTHPLLLFRQITKYICIPIEIGVYNISAARNFPVIYTG